MARIRVDDPAIDADELQARVERAIESRRGSRFSDAELKELRDAPLEPRLRRADLPRGLVDELGEAAGGLPPVAPAPGPEALQFGQTRDTTLDRSGSDGHRLADRLHAVQRGGLRGRVVGLLRGLMRPFYRATLNLDHVVESLEDRARSLADRDDRYLDYLEARLERTLDLLKDNQDQRVDRTADWAGQHLSALGGQLDARRQRELHLLHNLVYELTDARLQLQLVGDRLHEAMRRLAQVEERQRSLERLTLGDESAE